MANQIVTVNVSQQVASAPNALQKTGAFISQGGTILAANSSALITQISDLTAILVPQNTLTAISWVGSVVTFTTAAPHNVTVGQSVKATISGVTPSGYNGTFLATATGANTMTYPLGTNPGVETILGGYVPGSVAELTAMAATYFAEGTSTAVYVLELGAGGSAAGVAALTSYIASPTTQFYSYLFPQYWDTEPTAVTMAKAQNGTTAQVYFYVSSTLATYALWGGIKSVYINLQSPLAPTTEFTCAAPFWVSLHYNPSAAQMVSPFQYTFVYGVTPYALTNPQQVTLTAAGVNWIGTGAQGQISNTLIQNGVFSDLHPFNYWYSIDWAAINCQSVLAQAVINGSNTPGNPLYYNQAGINTLEKVAQATINNGISFGLLLTPATVFAISFVTYTQQNPTDYNLGIYRGLSVSIVPQRGFAAITFNLTAALIPV